MNLVFMTFYLGVFLSLHSCFAVHCPPLFFVTFFFVRLLRSPLLVVLFFRTSFSSLFLRCGCFGRLSWLYCSSARFPLYYFASWLFRSPLLVELSFHALFFWFFVLWLFRSPLLVVLSFHTFFVFSVFRALWLFRSPLLVVLFFRTLLPYCTAFSPFSLSPPFVS